MVGEVLLLLSGILPPLLPSIRVPALPTLIVFVFAELLLSVIPIVSMELVPPLVLGVSIVSVPLIPIISRMLGLLTGRVPVILLFSVASLVFILPSVLLIVFVVVGSIVL